jgi:hypothetical protein
MDDVSVRSRNPRHPAVLDRDPIALARKLVPDGELTAEDQLVLAQLRHLGEPALDELLACALAPRATHLTGLPYVDANETRAKAIYALGLLRAERTVEPILRALAATKPHTAERGFLGSCCALFGPLALEPALRLCRTSPLGPSDALLMLLASLGVRDARVLELLTSFLPINPAAAASLLALYGDAEALPALRAALAGGAGAPALQPQDEQHLRKAIQKLDAGRPAPAATSAAPKASPLAARPPATRNQRKRQRKRR